MRKINDYWGKLTLIGKSNQYSLHEYRPTLVHPLAIDFEPLRIVRRFRFWFEILMGGYRVYYLAVDGEFVGYCVVTPGGRRLSVSTKKDIVLGPYFVSPKHRGKGYATECLNYASAIAQKENCYKMMLLTGSKNESTLRFYENAGYNSADKTAFIKWL